MLKALNEQTGEMTYRNLHLLHAPQQYRGFRLRHSLAMLRAHPQSGELAHPGEPAQLAQAQQRQQQRDEKIRRTMAALRGEPPPAESQAGAAAPNQAEADEGPTAWPGFRRAGQCKFCGQQTEDWVSFDGKSRLCVCRPCANKEQPII